MSSSYSTVDYRVKGTLAKPAFPSDIRRCRFLPIRNEKTGVDLLSQSACSFANVVFDICPTFRFSESSFFIRRFILPGAEGVAHPSTRQDSFPSKDELKYLAFFETPTTTENGRVIVCQRSNVVFSSSYALMLFSVLPYNRRGCCAATRKPFSGDDVEGIRDI